MDCPKCGVVAPPEAERCTCGYNYRTGRYELDEDSSDAGEQARIYRAIGRPLRRCAKCGKAMYLSRRENMFFHGLIPSGQRIYFQCLGCDKEIKVRSSYRLLLAVPGCLMFALMFWALYPFESIWFLGFVVVLGFYPLILVLELITRLRYPTIRIPD
jgi:hypothetical protein